MSPLSSSPIFATHARWIGEPRPILGWWTVADGGAVAGRTAAVIAPPLGYEYWSTHRTLRTLAERLASANVPTLRFDYDGTGDSAGEAWDHDRLARWRESVRRGVDEVRALGAARVVLVGMRVGATLAAVEAASLGVDALVAWVPVLSGRRYARELRMLGLPIPVSEERPREGCLVYAGTVFTPDTLADLGELELEKMEARPAPRVLIVARPGQPCERWREKLAERGAEVELRVVEGSESALEAPSEEATVPEAPVATIVEWILRGQPVAHPDAGRGDPPQSGDGKAKTRFLFRGTTLTEEVVRVGERGLVGILGRPRTPRATVVFLNSGSEPHVGPGRCWVDYARALNLRGYATLRVDFSGWGESPDLGHAPGRPYDAHGVEETAEMVAYARAQDAGPVVTLGLCASAWIALCASAGDGARVGDTARNTLADAVIAINPQLYWEPGQPVEALLSTTRARRSAERAIEERGRESGEWSRQDEQGERPLAGRWLVRLRESRTPVLMLFAEGDDGIEFLRNRVERRLAIEQASGWLHVVELPAIDHQMYREWLREGVVNAIETFLVGAIHRAALPSAR